MSHDSGGVARRSTHVFLGGLMACAVIGFVVGIGAGVPRPSSEEPDYLLQVEGLRDVTPMKSSRVPTDAPPAVSYDDLGARGPSAYKPSRYTVADLGVPVVDLSKEVVIDPKAKPGSLAERALRRAYNGAPPVVPHATEQISDRECVACHSTGLEIGGKRASLIPHAYYANCQQCHVAASPILPEHPLAQNSFAGMPAPTEGGRAWKGAPPVIPHSTWMREQCLSCHGPLGKAGMQTPHPGRVNCMQCHARSSALDPREPTVATLVYRPPVELRHGVNPMQETAPEAEAP